ncbi:MAG: hypothetical protein WCS47_06055, partial [Thermovirgaceae bacterium]|nr:hypothetical protein [Synergistales bacterium]MDD5515376.1 hypothetical protein [Synergistales bacterium]
KDQSPEGIKLGRFFNEGYPLALLLGDLLNESSEAERETNAQRPEDRSSAFFAVHCSLFTVHAFKVLPFPVKLRNRR